MEWLREGEEKNERWMKASWQRDRASPHYRWIWWSSSTPSSLRVKKNNKSTLHNRLHLNAFINLLCCRNGRGGEGDVENRSHLGRGEGVCGVGTTKLLVWDECFSAHYSFWVGDQDIYNSNQLPDEELGTTRERRKRALSCLISSVTSVSRKKTEMEMNVETAGELSWRALTFEV